jgi:hypothetical protein
MVEEEGGDSIVGFSLVMNLTDAVPNGSEIGGANAAKSDAPTFAE